MVLNNGTSITNPLSTDPFDILVNENISEWDRQRINEVFFEYTNGKLEFIKKAQVASLYNTFLVTVYLELTKIVGRAGKGLILNSARKGGYKAGYAIRRRYEREMEEMDEEKSIFVARNMLSIWSKGFGWGDFSVSFGEDRIDVKIYDSFEGEGYKKLVGEESERGMCWMISGYIWGLLEGLLNVKLIGEDKKCVSKGDDFCLTEFHYI